MPGLGLYLCRQIIAVQDWHNILVSAVGGASRRIALLPLSWKGIFCQNDYDSRADSAE
jgi:hypothetical protein